MFASLDWLPTFVDIAGGAKGNDLRSRSRKAPIPASSRPRSTASTSATTSKARRTIRRVTYFFYYSGSTPSAVRYKNWKMYYTMTQSGAAGWPDPLINFHWTIVAEHQARPLRAGCPVRRCEDPGERSAVRSAAQ